MRQIAVLLLLPITTSGVKGDVLNVVFWNLSRSSVEGRPIYFHSDGRPRYPNSGHSAISYMSLLAGCCSLACCNLALLKERSFTAEFLNPSVKGDQRKQILWLVNVSCLELPCVGPTDGMGGSHRRHGWVPQMAWTM